MEQYFTEISKSKGYDVFEKEAWGFKVKLFPSMYLYSLMS